MKFRNIVKSYAWVVVLMAFLVVFPIFIPSLNFMNIMSEILIMAIFALSLNLLIGYTGLVSFGHAAFFAIGSYTVGIILQKYSISIFWALICGMALAGIAALLIGFFVTRLTAIYFSFLTLAFGQIIYTIIVKWEGLTGGDPGLVGGIPRPPLDLFGWVIDMQSPVSLYYLIVVMFLISTIIIKIITDSPFGWIMRAIRENSERINFLGINVRRFQIIIFTISGIFTALAGGLVALHVSGAYSDHAYWSKSAEPIFMIMVGGMRVFAGPILGAFIVTELSAYVNKFVGLWGLIFGGFLIAYLMISREGILDVIQAKWKSRVKSNAN
jgi:branched-chain amino acid transport system permease protein